MSEAQTSVKPVETPLNLIPVGLKEAALDSPTFRATSLHFDDQVDVIERWLDGYIRAASKLVSEVSNLEATVNSFLTQSAPPNQISEAVLDHDYALLAVRRYGEGAREYWNQTFRGVKRYESTVIEPIRTFLNGELRQFKEARRALDWNQKNFDAVIQRYSSQSKSKEASSLREDAFQLHEARKAYLKASMDYCTSAPQLRTSLDQLIVRIFADQFKEMRNGRDASAATFTKLSSEMERVRGWSREMENSERAFKKELLLARQQIENSVLDMTKPSRELGDYELSNKPSFGTGASAASVFGKTDGHEKGEKQGWLFLKTLVGKPTRTVWVRRWFYVKHGIFGWLVQGSRSGGVEESEKTGVLLCGVRTAEKEERRFTFEVKTNATSIILQAETQVELSEWISAFEFAKRKALEDPASTDTSAQPTGIDPAFAISPPIAPEFAARVGDTEQRGEEAGDGLSIPVQEGTGLGIAQRASFDVNAARRVTSIDREPTGSTSRIIQKLDLHKRGSATPSTNQAPTMAGGIASLISASHNALPVGPGTPQSAVNEGPTLPGVPPRRNFTMTLSTLAPNSLANPPAPTNLSHTAVVVSGERGVSLGGKADGSGMPGGIMANLWGSSNWGHVNRLVDEPPKSPHQRSVSETPSPQRPVQTSVDDMSVRDGTDEMAKEMPSLTHLTTDPSPSVGHRKTMSVAATTDMNLPSQVARPSSSDREEYPNYYPLPLKAQHGQFRILFPSVPRAEKVVLVFRATWNPNEQQEFPGRVYVTTKEVYFYSHYLGFVLVTGVSLSSISDVTAAPGRDCDFLYLHLKEANKVDSQKRITIRVFLDSLRLLQRRLNFLVHNANEDEPLNLEEVIKALIKMEFEKQERSSSVDSWDDLDYDVDDAAPGADENSPPNRRGRNIKASLRIDGNLYGDTARTGREIQKFQLPRQAVVYAPQGMQASVTREFNVSAKALFHVIFGDKSAVFQLLYCNRWNDKITQTPWSKDNSDHWIRRFASEANRTPMQDTQTIDIFNDHLCYVVTNNRVPWRLPYAKDFHLATKLVITHVAKSRCKLAIFQQVSWYRRPSLDYIKGLIEKHAHNALEADALDLTNVAMDQVTKLGNHSKTHKAIQIFGNIGQQATVPQIDASAIPSIGGSLASVATRGTSQPVSLQRLVGGDIMVKALRAVSMTFDVIVALAKGAAGLCTAHTLLVVMLLFSILYNSWYGYRDGVVWWHERSASKYMARLGVKPDPTIGKAIYLSDIEELVAPTIGDETIVPFLPSEQNGGKTCRSTFTEQLSTSMSLVSTGAPLHRSRDALARYRHDLLVAIRVVNRVEREIVLSEWEYWLHIEERKCSQVEALLQQNKSAGQGHVNMLEDVDERLGADFAQYCASCRAELAGFENRTSLM